MRRLALLCVMVAGAACGDDGDDGGDAMPSATVAFDLDAPLTGDARGTFWALPFPSDLRLTAAGGPDMGAFPNPNNVALLASFKTSIEDRRGFPVMPAAYFSFTAELPTRVRTDVLAASTDSDAFLIDIDAASPEHGALFPIIAESLPVDVYTADHLIALAPRAGIVLRASTRYAYVVRTSFAPGFTAPAAFAQLAAGETPAGARGAAAAELYAPLWTTLAEAGVDTADVLVATVFTTGDEVARLRARSEGVRAAFSPAIENLALVGGDTYDGFCRLDGTIVVPQFQIGTPPFTTEGHFALDANGIPQRQGDLEIPISITLPKSAMPAGGWPLYQYFHGSGGRSIELVDRGRIPTPTGTPEPGKGPGYVVARYGLAAAAAALPVNPQRLEGATDYEYLNLDNLDAFPFTFQQGVIEQRLITDALVAIQIPQATLAGCTIPAPVGGMHHFDETKLVAGGQSMGGMYTNMVGAIEPRFGALNPTGAGGFWNLMILEASVIPGARELIAGSLGIDFDRMSFVHPALHTMELGWEIADPLVYMARIARRPLDGIPARNVYESVPKDDENFTTSIYDASALAYGNQQAGDVVWPEMQDVLALDGIDGLASYPVRANRDGLTRVVVQFEGDGIVDPHYIFQQLEAVKHQYGCFLASYVRDGVPTVPAPGVVGDPCP